MLGGDDELYADEECEFESVSGNYWMMIDE